MNGVVVHGTNLPPNTLAQTNGTEFVATLYLAEGDILDVLAGRGADGNFNGAGANVQATLRWLNADPQLPTFLRQPQGLSIQTGGLASFEPLASGTRPLSYQWLKDGMPLSWATQPSLQLYGAQWRHQGAYQVVVSNLLGAVTSQVAQLVVANRMGISHGVPGVVIAWGSDPYGQTDVPGGLTNVVAISGGGYHSLALLDNGTVVGWGQNTYNQATNPAFLTNVTAIAAGGEHSLVLLSNDTVLAWGKSASGETNVPVSASNVVAIAAGGYHNLALRRDGTVVGWGNSGFSQNVPPASATNAVAIAAGNEHSLILKADGKVVAWGYNNGGQSTVPSTLSNVVAITAGRYHSLALQQNGTVVAWGLNTYGQTAVPAGLSNVAAIAAGESHSAALKSDGRVIVWGSSSQTNVPASAGKVLALSAGWSHNLALMAAPAIAMAPQSRIVTVGSNVLLQVTAFGVPPLTYQWFKDGGALPDATNASLALPDVQAGQAGAYTVTVSNAHGMATSAVATVTVVTAPPQLAQSPSDVTVRQGAMATFSVEASGEGLAYQWLKDGIPLMSQYNRPVLPLFGVQFLHQGQYQVIVSNLLGAVTSAVARLIVTNSFGGSQFIAGTVLAWGANNAGQTNVPTSVSNVVALSAGYDFCLAVRSNGTVAAWGANDWGQTSVPAGLSNVIALAAGANHSLALKTDGTLAAWGNNGYGKATIPAGLSNVIAIATRDNFNLALRAGGTPVAWGNSVATNVPAGLSNVVAVAAGWYHSVALKADGAVVAWGENGSGQCNVPASLSNAVAISSGSYHSLALRQDGTVVAWGDTASGKTTVPSGLSSVVAIAAGDTHSMALKNDGSVVVWGSNSSMQTNVPTGLRNVLAIAAGRAHCMALAPTPPSFVIQPRSQAVLFGAPVSLEVTVLGASPLTYQWFQNGAVLADATNASLLLPGAQTSQTYTVTASNAFGMATSAVARISVVTTPPAIAQSPSDVTARQGTVVSLAVEATGDALSFQWLRGGVSLAGATNATLTFYNVQPFLQGRYQVVVTNLLGALTSQVAQLVVTNSMVYRQNSAGRVLAWGNNGSGQTNVPSLDQPVAVSAGGNHSLALLANGSVVGWGLNSSGQATPPSNLSNALAVAAGGEHSLALRSNGTVVAWGLNNSGQTNVPAGATNVVAIAAGGYHNLALRQDGTVVGWGNSGFSQTVPPSAATNVVAVAAGNEHSLALRNDGRVVAWGYNNSGQTTVPANLSNVVAIAAGRYHSMALKQDGTLTVWGTTAPAGLSNIVAVTGGQSYSAVLQQNGPLVAWGNNTYGQTNVPPAATHVMAVSAGWQHCLALVAVPPAMVRQPLSRAVLAGSQVLFEAGANGTEPLSYQWFHNGIPLENAMQDTLRLTDVRLVHAGDYSVIVSNVGGMATSAVATLTVLVPAKITNQPLSRIINQGANVQFSAGAEGSPAPSYQWLFNGVRLNGYTNDTLLLTAVQPPAAGDYSVIVSNLVGMDTSVLATLTVILPPGILEPPASLTVAQGSNVLFLPRIAGSEPMTYQWHFNGTPIADANGQTLFLTSVQYTNAGQYSLTVSNAAGMASSPPATLTVNSKPLILVSPLSQTNVIGSNAVFGVTAVGTPTLRYHWRFNGAFLTAATNATLLLTNLQPAKAGGYSVVVSNAYGKATSAVASLTVVTPPAITAQPASKTVKAGTNATFQVTATGTGPLTYRWLHHGSLIGGSVTNVLTLTAVQPAQAGSYQVVVSNFGGSVTSTPATLTVQTKPVILIPPASLHTNAGAVVALSVLAEGTAPLFYRWRRHGTNLNNGGRVFGVTNATLVLTNLQFSEAGLYTVIVSNMVGTVTSAPPALLTVASARLHAGAWSNGLFQVNLTGVTNRRLELQVCTNLPAPGQTSAWMTVQALTNRAGTVLVQDPAVGQPRRFYRVVAP